MHIVVGGILEKDGKVLLVQEAQEKCYGKWNIPAGHLDCGETLKEGAIREIKEETNIDVEIDNKFRKVITYSPKEGVMKDVVFFIGKAISLDLIIDSNELLEAKWVGVNEVKNYFNYKENTYVFEEAIRYLGVYYE